VLRKGTLFPARANKLYQLYRQYSSLDDIDARTRSSIEQYYFNHRSFEDIWTQTQEYFLSKGNSAELQKAERNPRHKMALVFKWYFAHSIRVAMEGDTRETANYQIHCGPAMGSFNAFVKGTKLENWRNRHVDVIAEALMHKTAALLEQRFSTLTRLR
jgi:trans-AT polyketide synthase/acyltransferase/oxidoreductase domain-containing protein